MEKEPLQAAARDWIAWCIAGGKSPKTVDGRRYALSLFLPWCEEQQLSTLDQITNRVIDRYSAELQTRTTRAGKPFAKSSVHKWVKEINTLMAWAHRELGTAEAKGQKPTLARQIKEVLSREEVQALEDSAQAERDKLIVRLLADSGLRLAELILLTPESLVEDRRQPYLRVMGKGRGGQQEERIAVLKPLMFRRLARYAAKGRPESIHPNLWLGLRRSATTGQYEPLTESGVEQMLGALGRAAGIQRKVHPHLFRHSLTTHLLKQGVNTSTVAKALGWKSTQMIDRHYSHLQDTEAWDSVLRAMD